MKRMIGLIILVLPLIGFAQIYKSTQGGVPTFTDKPSPGAKTVDIPQVQTFPSSATKVQSKQTPVGQQQTATIAYQKAVIGSPTNDEAVRSNNGEVTVNVVLVPALQAGDLVQVYLDDKPVGRASNSTTTVLQNVSRGTHTVSATVINSQGQTIANTGVVTFHLQRVALGGNVFMAPLTPAQRDLQKVERLLKLENPNKIQELQPAGLQSLQRPNQIQELKPAKETPAQNLIRPGEINTFNQPIKQGETPKDQQQGSVRGQNVPPIIQGQTPGFQKQGSLPRGQ